MIYLWEKYPSLPRSLYGETPEQKSEVNKMLSWGLAYLIPSISEEFYLRRECAFRLKQPIPEEQLKKSENKMIEALEKFDLLIG